MIEENKKLQPKVNWMSTEITNMRLEGATIDQKMRENNIEISGIPSFIEDEELEKKSLEVLNLITPSKINSMDLQACHRLQSRSANKPTIIKFVNMKHAEQSIANKIKLKRLDFTQIGFPQGSKIYKDMNCCKRINHLSYHCRKLKADKLIHKFFANANGSIRITIGSGTSQNINGK